MSPQETEMPNCKLNNVVTNVLVLVSLLDTFSAVCQQ